MKRSPFILFSFFVLCSFMSVAYANPIPFDPWTSWLRLDLIVYVSIIIAEFCGLIVGTAILTHYKKARWQKASIIILIALLVSYALGIILWSSSYQAGIITYDFTPLGVIMLWLPEFVGTAIGSIIIKRLQKTTWKMAIITMSAAMIASLLISLLLGYIRLILL